jgi:threonine aldolase
MQDSDESLKYAFASDNCAGVCPEAWDALQTANNHYVGSYGADRWTQRAVALIRELFEYECEVFFAFNGTAANSLALAALCRSYQSVIAHRFSHIQTDECGCPEFITGGTKILLVDGPLGIVNYDQVDAIASYRRDVHFPTAKVLDLTQATEFGTVYDPQTLGNLGQLAKRHGLKVHIDGARFANALASLGCSAKELTWKAGVDCITLGGTKNGMAVGECVVFFNRDAAAEFGCRMKQAGQLASKMRYLSAPWVGVLESGTYVKHALHANQSAQKLASKLQAMQDVEIAHPPQANAVFARFPQHVWTTLENDGWHFYDLFGTGEARLMCSWATTEDEIDAFCTAVHNALIQAAAP